MKVVAADHSRFGVPWSIFIILCTALAPWAVARAQGRITGERGNSEIELPLKPASPGLIADAEDRPNTDQAKRIDDAITRGLAVVQKAAQNYPSHRQCFSCHHQTLPLLAMDEAQAAGFDLDDEVAEIIREHTLKSFS